MTHNIQWFLCWNRADYKPGQVWSEAKQQKNMMDKCKITMISLDKIDSKIETIKFTVAT